MNIVYYRKKIDGKIRTCHEVKEDSIPSEELPEKIAEYNQNSKDDTAELYVITPGSFEEHLWETHKAIKRLNKETLDELEDSLNDALDVVHDLMCQLERAQ